MIQAGSSPRHTGASQRDGEFDLFFVVIAFAIASAVSFPVHVVAGFLVGEAIDGQGLVIGVIGGGLVQAFSSIFYRKAALSTDNLGINALGYVIPISIVDVAGVIFPSPRPSVDSGLAGDALHDPSRYPGEGGKANCRLSQGSRTPGSWQSQPAAM